MKRYFLELSYAGKNYHGWQRQPSMISIQQTIEDRMRLLLREPVELTVAGRTDAGVHAKRTFAHFDVEKSLDIPMTINRLNSFLPQDIAVMNILPVKAGAHARYDAIDRTYRYIIVTKKNPFMTDWAWRHQGPLDVKAMQEAAEILMKYEDFKSFSKVKTDVKTFICQIKEARWEIKDDRLDFVITANRFLRNMVRAIVGTLVDIGSGKYEPEQMHRIIQARDRRAAGASAPPQGLYLENVRYPQEIFLPNH